MRKIWNKIVIAVISCTLAFTGVLPEVTTVYATQNRMGNFSTSYSLTGNGADDIISVAKAQVGKTGSQLGYSEEWCADFVGDCAALANQGSAIPRNGYCPSLQTAILNAGGQTVSISSARKGDIAFYGTNGSSHVEIIYANNNGTISSIGGNSGSGSTCYTRSVRNHSTQSMTITKVIRPNYGSSAKILPGTVASGWNVPTTVTASKRITTYNEYGNAESNHYIAPGDSCYISEVYTNGFVKVQYPISGGKRWAYAKASDFSISQASASQLPDTQLHVWFSLSPMGDDVTSIRYNDLVYLCYRVETKDGNLLNSSAANYSVKETLYFPDGSTFPYNYDKSNNNWIRSNFKQWGTYKGIVEISGDYTGKVEVSYTLNKPEQSLLSCWFSSTKMGNSESYLEKGKTYYFCYKITYNNGYLNQYMNLNYTVTEDVYGPDGKKVCSTDYETSDRNGVRFTATQTGDYKGVITIKGDLTTGASEICVCKDTTVRLQSIKITKNPTKTTYTVGEAIDLRGMVVTAGYSNGSTKNVTGYKISGNALKAGTATVMVSYTEGGVTCKDSFTITVKEKEIAKETETDSEDSDIAKDEASQAETSVSNDEDATEFSSDVISEDSTDMVDESVSDGVPSEDLSNEDGLDDDSDYDDTDDDDGEEDDSEALEVGDEIVTDQVIYTITQLEGAPCVEYTELFDEGVANVTIPNTIEKDGITYRVTSIGEKAFCKNEEIKKVTIGKYITTIGKKAFYGCTSLKRITIKTKKLTSGSIGTSAFTKIYKKARIDVPTAKYKAYKKMLKKAGVGSKTKICKL